MFSQSPGMPVNEIESWVWRHVPPPFVKGSYSEIWNFEWLLAFFRLLMLGCYLVKLPRSRGFWFCVLHDELIVFNTSKSALEIMRKLRWKFLMKCVDRKQCLHIWNCISTNAYDRSHLLLCKIQVQYHTTTNPDCLTITLKGLSLRRFMFDAVKSFTSFENNPVCARYASLPMAYDIRTH